MKIFKSIFVISALTVFPISVSTYVWGQDSKTAAEASVCSVILELAAYLNEGTALGSRARGYAEDFKNRAFRHGMSGTEFARNRQLLLDSLAKNSSDEAYASALNGCIIQGERLGIIR